MDSRAPANVCWIFVSEDEPIARELMSRASALEAQGMIENWYLSPAGTEMVRVAGGSASDDEVSSPDPTSSLRRADVAMFLCSPALLANDVWQRAYDMFADSSRARIVPVLLSSVGALPPQLVEFQSLPRNGYPILGQRNREQALLDVIQGLIATVSYRDVEPTAIATPRWVNFDSPLKISEIFRLDGPPTITFVEPPEFGLLKHYLGVMGSGLIVEGPSKVGKSTAIRKAMEILGVAADDQIWWRGQRLPPFDVFSRKLDELLERTRDTWLFIDDFHYVEDIRYRRDVASVMKILADQPVRHAKVTLIGINPLGGTLVDVMPDLSGRFRILKLDIEKNQRGNTNIAQLITRGEGAANIRFTRRDEFVLAAGGSYFIAQYLCNMAAVKAGVEWAQTRLVEIPSGPRDITAAVQGELAAKFRAPLVEFAAFAETLPPPGAMLSLLWLLARSGDGFVSVREARLRFPMLNVAFDWLLASNLSRCFVAHPRLKGLLYYNRTTQTLTMEDPELRFYLRALDWQEFAAASGHGRIRFHSEDGPLWPIGVTASSMVGAITSTGTAATGALAKHRRVLHLSDLHFSLKEEAIEAYSQLAADLRQQQVEALDLLVVSGDLVNRADDVEYDAARLFLERLMSSFALSARQVALVPGNHDVSWARSEAAYQPHRRSRYKGILPAGAYIESGDFIEIRGEDAYRLRFQPFAKLYREIKGVDYPLAYDEQATIDDLAELGICVLGLNSAWEVDHHFSGRASIHPVALASALDKLGAPAPGQLRIATFHHPLGGGEDSRIRDTAFMQRLAVAGFRLVLHGHVHKADTELYRYDRSEQGRRIDVVAAGTFGAHTREWVPGYPLEYNLLLVGDDQITVETRCRREVNGAWGPDARWLQGPGQDPLPRYVLSR